MELNLNRIKLNIEGESHSKNLSISFSGFPTEEIFNIDELQNFMDRRHGDGSYLSELCSTKRLEPDIPVFDSGISKNDSKNYNISETTIKAHIDNEDVNSKDYDCIRTKLRPGHSDLGAYLKYGKEGLKPGGGDFSGRMTAGICLAGGIAKQILLNRGIEINSYILQMAGTNIGFLDEEEEQEFINYIEAIKDAGDSCGGIAGCVIKGMPAGIGNSGTNGLESDFAKAMFAIPSVKGIEFGTGFSGTYERGSENNDEYFLNEGEIYSRTNRQGGISGGISTGMNISMNIAFKPVPSISIPQKTVDVETMQETTIITEGRHDVCVLPRVLPVVEATAALVVLDRLED